MILVTGATGLVGYHLCKKLVSEGHEVMGLVHCRVNSLTNSLLTFRNFKICIADIRDEYAIHEVLKRYEIKTVFHTAAQLPYTPNKDLIGVNVHGVLHLLNAAHLNTVEEFIYVSSISVYSDPPSYIPVDEAHPTQPSSVYGMTKLAGELCCGVYAESMRIAILRFAGIYGTNSEENRAINNFIRCALSNQSLIVDGDGSQSSDFVHVDDVIQGAYLAWEKQISGVYNIGSGQETTIKELAKEIINLTKSKSNIVFNGKKIDRPFRFYLDITKAKRDFGYSPCLLRDGISNYIKELK